MKIIKKIVFLLLKLNQKIKKNRLLIMKLKKFLKKCNSKT